MIVALAQIAPVFLNREATLAKVETEVREAAARGARLVAFGEALAPGYTVWIERTDGARFESALQKEFHALYLEQAVQPEAGHLADLCDAARETGCAVILGVIERAADRGGHSVYCSRVFIDGQGELKTLHRKLMPTYEERLSWAQGDGAGLEVHPVGEFQVGSLLCWENWMPLARTALYAQGEDLHVALWPGGLHNTKDLTRHIAREGRSFCLSVSGLLRESDLPADLPARDRVAPEPGELLLNGGSCIAGPDGQWVLEPQVGEEGLYLADLDPRRVLEERQTFDPTGHYSRPDVLNLRIDRRRQTAADLLR